MVFAYEKLMDEHNLSVSDLPSDAKEAIVEISKMATFVERKKQNGEVVPTSTINKLRLNDKFIVREILDYIDELEEEEDQEKVESVDPKGVKVEAELKALYEKGVSTLTLDQISNSAATTYSLIFDGYEDGGKNGVKTSVYSLIESEPEVFKLSKN